jgi:hypothetical protein
VLLLLLLLLLLPLLPRRRRGPCCCCGSGGGKAPASGRLHQCSSSAVGEPVVDAFAHKDACNNPKVPQPQHQQFIPQTSPTSSFA